MDPEVKKYLDDFPEKFGTIIADPPWNYERTTSNEKLRGYSDKHYEPLTTDVLCELPVGSLASPNSVLMLWTTGPFLISGEAVKVAEAWGFVPKSLLTWVKTTSSEGTTLKYGVGHWFRGATEYVVVCSRRGGKSYRSAYQNLLENKYGDDDTELDIEGFVHPALKHSRKPDNVHQIAETTYPGERLEMFSRQEKDGWYMLGNEAPHNEKADIRETLGYLASRTARIRV